MAGTDAAETAAARRRGRPTTAAPSLLPAPAATTSPPPAAPRPPPVVYVFDLDECLVLMESLRTGAHARATGADPATAAAQGLVGEKLTAAVLEVADARLGFATVEADASPVSLAEGAGVAGAGGEPYRVAAALLAAGDLLTVDQAARAAGLRSAADGLTGGWLAAAGRLLAGLAVAGGAGRGLPGPPGSHHPPRPVAAVCVSAGHLLPTLAKLALFGLASFFGPGAVLSSRGLAGGKGAVFQTLADEAGPGAAFCVVGDGAEEERAARARGWPFVRVGPVAAGGEFGAVAGGDGAAPDALGRQATPLTRLTVLDLRRAAGLL